jgi:lipoprotein-anchoring transpeptidase ErfK/SrfK
MIGASSAPRSSVLPTLRGAAALTLSGGGEYAIHGTNNPGSVGGFVSYGCIRM